MDVCSATKMPEYMGKSSFISLQKRTSIRMGDQYSFGKVLAKFPITSFKIKEFFAV